MEGRALVSCCEFALVACEQAIFCSRLCFVRPVPLYKSFATLDLLLRPKEFIVILMADCPGDDILDMQPYLFVEGMCLCAG